MRHIKWHETCKCKCRIDASVIINKGGMKIDAGVNVKNWLRKVYVIKDLFRIQVIECECDKLCVVGEYLDYENCKCRKKLVDKLVEECTENVKEVILVKITSAEDENNHKNKCCSCTLYIVFFSIMFTINVGIGTYFVYHKHMNHNTETDAEKKKFFLNNNY